MIWAQTDEGIRGFLVPTETPGFTATPIEPKLSMRASIQCEIELDGVRLPADALLPERSGLRGPFSCLNEARYGIMWGAMGAARDFLRDRAGLLAATHAVRQALAGYQLTQRKLVNMALEINKGSCWRCISAGSRTPAGCSTTRSSVGKLNNCARPSRSPARPAPSSAATASPWSTPRCATQTTSSRVRTYEGTDEVHTLILGQQLTGIPAFR